MPAPNRPGRPASPVTLTRVEVNSPAAPPRSGIAAAAGCRRRWSGRSGRCGCAAPPARESAQNPLPSGARGRAAGCRGSIERPKCGIAAGRQPARASRTDRRRDGSPPSVNPQAVLLSSDNINDPLRYDDNPRHWPPLQRPGYALQLQRRRFDVGLGRGTGDGQLIPSLAIYLYGNGNPIVNEQRRLGLRARADRRAGCCIQAAPSSPRPNAA